MTKPVKMKAATLRALNKSIDEKWEPLSRGVGVDMSDKNCALCIRFNPWDCTRETQNGVETCPVDLANGGNGCIGTPYEHFIRVARLGDGGFRYATNRKSRAAAAKERDFLISLKPEE